MNRAIVLATLAIAGCAGGGTPQPAAQLPVSQQTPVGDARTRAKSHTDLGMLYVGGGQYGVALEEARAALAADSSYAGAYNLLGLVHMFLGENQRAFESFDKAAALAPNDPEINNNFGWFLCLEGREKEGLQRLLIAAANPLYNSPTRPLFNAGLCSVRLKDDAAAEGYFRRALIADGSNAAAYYQLAEIGYRKGKYEEARRYLSELHRVAEPSAESVWLALRTERKLGDRQAEASFNSQLRRKFPGTPQHQAMLEGRYE